MPVSYPGYIVSMMIWKLKYGLTVIHTQLHFLIILKYQNISGSFSFQQVDVLPSKNQALCDLVYNVLLLMGKSRE